MGLGLRVPSLGRVLRVAFIAHAALLPCASGLKLPANDSLGLDKRVDVKDTITFSSLTDIYDVTLTEVPKKDPRALGSCYKWRSKVEKAYAELNALLESGSRGGSVLLKGPPPAERADYIQKHEAFKNMFGRYPGDPEAFTVAQKDVKGTYDAYIQAHQLRSGEKGPRFYLKCTDDFLKWLDPTSKDPRDAGTVNEGKRTLAKPSPGHKPFPRGAWHALGMPLEHALLDTDAFAIGVTPFFSRGTISRKNPLCAEKTYKGRMIKVDSWAYSVHSPPLLVFCESQLNHKISFLSEVEEYLKPDYPLDMFYPTLARTWAHELGHLIMNWPDPESVEPKKQDESSGKPSDASPEDYVNDIWSAADLARVAKEKSLKAPEPYTWFALMAHFDNWFWGSGKDFGLAHKDYDHKKYPDAAPVVEGEASGSQAHAQPRSGGQQ